MSQINNGVNQFLKCPSFIGVTFGGGAAFTCNYLTEDGLSPYVAEDGTTFYIPEDCLGAPSAAPFNAAFNLVSPVLGLGGGRWRVM